VLYQVQDDLIDAFGATPGEEPGGDIREGKLTVLAAHCLSVVEAEKALWLWGVLHQPSDATSSADLVAAKALYERAGSVDFALAELDRRRSAALSVPGLARHPVLIAVLADACDLFLEPVRTLLV
jgi:geranylgeranyl pyrophosphate synthase